MKAIEVDGLGKCYRVERKRTGSKKQTPIDLWALKDVSFEAGSGEVLGIIGRNGAGKTTLLKLLGRVTAPTAGRAVLRGRVISLLEMGMGFQPELTARENIFLNAAIYGIPPREVKKNLDRIIMFAELEKFMDGPPLRHFSSGMYLRLAFSVAVNMDPDILLADEVLAVGDLGFQERCMARMREVGKQGTTVLFVSHDLQAVERLCDRCLRLDEGRKVSEGPTAEVIAEYQKSLWEVSAKSPSEDTARTSPSGDHGEVVSMELRDLRGARLDAVKVTEGFEVVITFRTFLDGLRLQCGFNLLAGRSVVFRSIAPEIFLADVPGTYQATCQVPAGLLADITYGINGFVAFIDRGGQVIERKAVLYNALSFTVYDPAALKVRRTFADAKSYGLIAPRLDWGPVRKHLSGEVL